MTEKAPTAKPDRKAQKKARLAKALKANIKRRKDAARLQEDNLSAKKE